MLTQNFHYCVFVLCDTVQRHAMLVGGGGVGGGAESPLLGLDLRSQSFLVYQLAPSSGAT